MALKQLRITQTNAEIAIQTRRAELRVVQSRRMLLSLRQQPSSMQIERQLPRIKIDQTACFAESGLKTPLEVANTFYQESMGKGLETIGAIAQEGLDFLRIENKGNPIRDIAMQRGVHMRRPTITAMPKSRPDISVDPGFVDITWTPHAVNAHWEMIEGQVEYIPYEINFTMISFPSIDIRLEDGIQLDFPMPSATGRFIDEKQ